MYFCKVLVFFFFMLFLSRDVFAVFDSEPDLVDLVANVMGFFLKILGMIGIIAFLLCGMMYLSSFGNETKMENAKRYFTYSVIGLVIGIGSFIIMGTIDTLLR